MSAPSKLAYFVRTALGSVWRAPFVHVVAVAALALTLTSFGVARVLQGQLAALVASLGAEVEFTVYAKPGATTAQLEELAQALASRTGGAARVVSSAEALARLERDFALPGLAASGAALSPSVELTVPPAQRTPQGLAALAEQARAVPFVDEVDYGEASYARLSALARAFDVAALVVFVLVFITAVVVVAATLQLAIFARREEIEIQKLVGATDRFVRAPFLLEGAFEGALAAGLALAGLWGAAWLLETGRLAGWGWPAARLGVDFGRLAGELAGAGVALGVAGSFVAVRRFLRV